MLSPILLTSENDTALLVQDEPLYEIVDGQRVDLPPMSAYTTWLASRLQGRLGHYVEEHGLGTCVMEMLFILDAERNMRRRPMERRRIPPFRTAPSWQRLTSCC